MIPESLPIISLIIKLRTVKTGFLNFSIIARRLEYLKPRKKRFQEYLEFQFYIILRKVFLVMKERVLDGFGEQHLFLVHLEDVHDVLVLNFQLLG